MGERRSKKKLLLIKRPLDEEAPRSKQGIKTTSEAISYAWDKEKSNRSAWDKKKSNMKKFIPNDRFFPGNSPLPEGILIHLKGYSNPFKWGSLSSASSDEGKPGN
ncbi:hypothetical protein U9M48_007774 [Paspalum notatum var. saurae]|uniref:Uncharacterized protein n=1 Tax=Paspalum notatum var. saurae TaxID=547442 RepID=A0AAQ3SMU1_PASNO